MMNKKFLPESMRETLLRSMVKHLKNNSIVDCAVGHDCPTQEGIA